MKRWGKRLAIGLGVLLGLGAIALGITVAISHSLQGETYVLALDELQVPTDPAALAEGERLYASRGCAECHGADGSGAVIMDGPPARVAGSNLTRLGADYDTVAFDAAVRHGVGTDGRPLIFMPAHEYYVALSDADVAKIFAHVRSLPEVAEPAVPSEVRLLGRVLHVTGAMHMFPAELIDHEAPHPDAIEPAPTAAYGERLGAACTGCHGEGFSGGPIPGAPPELGTPKNLTPHASGLAEWDRDDFFVAMRDGRSRDGAAMNAEQMPYPVFARMTDVELDALWSYLQDVPPRPFGER